MDPLYNPRCHTRALVAQLVVRWFDDEQWVRRLTGANGTGPRQSTVKPTSPKPKSKPKRAKSAPRAPRAVRADSTWSALNIATY